MLRSGVYVVPSSLSTHQENWQSGYEEGDKYEYAGCPVLSGPGRLIIRWYKSFGHILFSFGLSRTCKEGMDMILNAPFPRQMKCCDSSGKTVPF